MAQSEKENSTSTTISNSGHGNKHETIVEPAAAATCPYLRANSLSLKWDFSSGTSWAPIFLVLSFLMCIWLLQVSHVYWIAKKSSGLWRILSNTAPVLPTLVLVAVFAVSLVALNVKGYGEERLLPKSPCGHEEYHHSSCPETFSDRPFQSTSKTDTFWMFVYPLSMVAFLTIGTVSVWTYILTSHESMLDSRWNYMLTIYLTIMTFGYDLGFFISVAWRWPVQTCIFLVISQNLRMVVSWCWHFSNLSNSNPLLDPDDTFLFALYETGWAFLVSFIVYMTVLQSGVDEEIQKDEELRKDVISALRTQRDDSNTDNNV